MNGSRLRVIDLGCGTGALAAAFALQNPQALVTATDRSASAVRSARATMAANGLEGRVQVTLDDAGSELPGASADLILLNPPFHLGASVHELSPVEEIARAARGRAWFQLFVPRDRGVTKDLVQRAEAAGCTALCITVDTPVVPRAGLAPGVRVEGPAIVEEFGSTVPIHPGFTATVDAYLNLILTRSHDEEGGGA